MFLARFQFNVPLWWKLRVEDPLLFALPKTEGWSLLSPICYPCLTSLRRPETHEFPEVVPGVKFGPSAEIALATSDESRFKNATKHPKLLEDAVGDLLLRLRHATGQADMPKLSSCMGYFFGEEADLPKNAPSASPLIRGYVQKYRWSSAVTAEHVHAAVKLDRDFVPLTHEVMLLDALAAHRASDYASSILYAAVSAEGAFGFAIDREHRRVLASHANDRFRIIGLNQAGGGLIHKDPVYERLRSKQDFGVLIHELSLYVLRRSLLAEDEALYQQAKRLYATRNRIVHVGGGGGKAITPFPVDAAGSIAALKTCLALFSWLGERADFVLPDVQFESV